MVSSSAFAVFGLVSGAEHELRAGVRPDHLLRQFRIENLVEGFARTMHRDDIVDVEIDQFLDGLAYIVLLVRRQMETSNHSVDLSHARHRYRLLQRVHRPAVPAGGQED